MANKSLDVYLNNYDNLLILGDLNSDLKMAAWMVFLMLTILKALTQNRIALKTQTTLHAEICFLRIVQDTF